MNTRPDDSLRLVGLHQLMQRTRGSRNVTIGLIDGPVFVDHRDLAGAEIVQLPGPLAGACTRVQSAACAHGTFVAGMLVAARTSQAPAICPDCKLLVRSIFSETTFDKEGISRADPQELGSAIVDCVKAGAHVLNLSLGLAESSLSRHRALEEALNYAASAGVIVVAAAGNQGAIGSSTITRHNWVIPVAACDATGTALPWSNFGNSIGTRGLIAPGDGVTSLGGTGERLELGGTSVAAAFVTGAIALLRSEFPTVSAASLRLAIAKPQAPHRPNVVPRLLDAWDAYQRLLASRAQ